MLDHTTMHGAIPDGPEAITASWLTAVLRASGALTDAVVVASAWELISSQGWTTQMARLALTYDRPAADAPAALVVKLSIPEASTRTFFGRFYAREVAFYQWVAPTVSLRVPRCYYADYDAVTLAHVLLLEDLTSAAAGDLSRGTSVEVALAYTRSIAALHAHWWEHERLDTLAEYFPPHGVTFAQGYAAGLERGLAVMHPYLDTTTRRLAARLQDGLQEQWNRQYATPRTLIHWDAQAANLLLPATADGPPIVVDWQNCTIARGIWDVARFCVMSLPVTDRRTAQRDILALYAKTLAAHGISDYSYAQCWADYQAVLPLLFAQQARFFASMQHWDATRRAWVEAITPRVVASLHDAAEAGLVGVG